MEGQLRKKALQSEKRLVTGYKHMYSQSGIIFHFDNFPTTFMLDRSPFANTFERFFSVGKVIELAHDFDYE